MLKKDKEFKYFDGYETYHYLITKVVKDTKGIITEIHATVLDFYRNEVVLPADYFDGLLPCLTNTEVFVMITNWKNFKRDGVHQDLPYAATLRRNILNTLKLRGVVREGDGKLEDYDRSSLMLLYKDIGD